MIILVLILAFGIRLLSLNQSLWIDEATSALTTRMNLADFFGKFMPGDFHPPLYYLTLRVWSLFFGTSEVALRSLSIVFAIVTIYLVYLIGKELISKETGKIASVLLATSGLHIYYSQEARMYAMSTFLVSLAIFSFVKILKTKRGGYWVILTIIIGLIGATDYLPLLILPVFFVIGIFTKQKRKWFYKLIMSHIILTILALLWLPIFIRQLSAGITITHTSPSWVNVLGKFSLKDILLIPVKFAIGRVSFDSKSIYAGFVLMVFLIFGLLMYKALRRFKDTKLIWFWLLVPILIALLISIKIPVLNYFRFLFILPAFYLVVAFGIDSLKGKVKFLVLAGVISINLITSFMYLTNMKFQREDWRSAVAFINQNRGQDYEILFPALSQMEGYRYYDTNAVLHGGVDEINVSAKELWLIRYAQAISDPNDLTRSAVERFGFVKSNEYDFNGVVVWKYNKLVYANRN